ncbi:PfkB family carbohydrate kinase [Mangrovicoccus sp. HB161399]|uniref:PfkB family carbohydrate kinase n=1 Tax=Mangrovicoccus sp. HB161399 TaxID=2720392 RepID=UPI0015577F50|nr:PfkB family carbohydrate kinase [Mangrovicoccus sp. HB161399]
MGALLQMTGPVLDLVYKVRALPRRGEEAVVTGFSACPGGGFNALAAARAAGMEARLGGSLGTGPMASVIAAQLAVLGIACARPPVADHDQGCCTVLLEPDGERSFVGFPGAEGEIAAGALAAIDLAGVSWVMVSGYSLHYANARDALADWLARLPQGIRLLFDPSPVAAELPETLLAPVMARADWISANAAEAAVLTGLRDPEAAAPALAEGREGAVVRRGADGCLLAAAGTLRPIPGQPVAPLDTNGAGDCHIGSFIAEFDRTGDPLAAARYANVAAALSTTREGPATPPARDEVLGLMPG